MTGNMTVKRLDGTPARVDMTKFVDIADGVSEVHPDWESLLVFCKELDSFVELSGGPQDIRGNSESDALEVDDAYAKRVYGKTRADV